MIKIMWFLKRADHLSFDEFRSWWVDSHRHLIQEIHGPHLLRYVVDMRDPDEALPGATPDETDWDGVAEQWFADEAAMRAVYEGPRAHITREDTMKHVGAFSRLVVHEHEFDVGGRDPR